MRVLPNDTTEACMKLLIKVNLALLAVFGAGLAVTGYLTDHVLQENARREVLSHASLMMEAASAARSYTSREIQPLLKTMQETQFLPQSVPSYAATQSFSKLHEIYQNYSYKEATLNPTNPRDRVVEWEADVVRNLRDHPTMSEMVGERATPSGQSLFLARPIQIKDAACLSCHSTPSAAPASMRALYGDANGFGWKHQEIVGSQIVSVPLEVPVAQANRTWKLIMIGMALTFACILALVNLALWSMLLRPMRKIVRIADAVSAGQLDAEPFAVRGSDEIAMLGGAFNRMRRSLEKAMAMLG
jgi:protein-histidine pros-kinase